MILVLQIAMLDIGNDMSEEKLSQGFILSAKQPKEQGKHLHTRHHLLVLGKSKRDMSERGRVLGNRWNQTDLKHDDSMSQSFPQLGRQLLMMLIQQGHQLLWQFSCLSLKAWGSVRKEHEQLREFIGLLWR